MGNVVQDENSFGRVPELSLVVTHIKMENP
jgi:hypothetical protein